MAVFIVGHSNRGGKKNIYTKRVTCVIFSLLPSSSGFFPFATWNQPKTTPNSLRLSFPLDLSPPRLPTRSNIPPRFVLTCDGCSLLCFILQKAFSLPTPRFCCWTVLSDPHINSEPPKLRTDTFSNIYIYIQKQSPTRLQRMIYQK